MVSICIATHNSEKFIYRTLECLRNQTYKDFEVVLVDDHSTDDTVNIILDFCMKDPRFKLAVNCTEVSYVDAHNLSYEMAKGEYLFRLDNDDVFDLDYIEFMVNYMKEHPNVDTCCVAEDFYNYTDYGIYKHDVITDDTAYCDPTPFNNDPALIYYKACFTRTNYQYWHNNTSCLKKEFYDKHQPKYRVFSMGDGIFWMEVFCNYATAVKINEVKMHKVSTNRNTYDNKIYRTIDDMCNFYATRAYSRYFNERFAPENNPTEEEAALRDICQRTYNAVVKNLKESGKWDDIPENLKLQNN